MGVLAFLDFLASEDFSLLVTFLLVAFSWLFRGPHLLGKQCLGFFFVAFSWLFRFGQILRVLALEKSSDCFSPFMILLAFLGNASVFFSEDFRRSVQRRILALFRDFPCVSLLQKTRKGIKLQRNSTERAQVLLGTRPSNRNRNGKSNFQIATLFVYEMKSAGNRERFCSLRWKFAIAIAKIARFPHTQAGMHRDRTRHCDQFFWAPPTPRVSAIFVSCAVECRKHPDPAKNTANKKAPL